MEFKDHEIEGAKGGALDRMERERKKKKKEEEVRTTVDIIEWNWKGKEGRRAKRRPRSPALCNVCTCI